MMSDHELSASPEMPTREECLHSHIFDMNYNFDNLEAWCDVLNNMSHKDNDIKPASLHLIATAMEDIIRETRKSWYELAIDPHWGTDLDVPSEAED